ncbi:MAG: SUMF1/EgtB/PvdO family nonheme iron enzyme [Candidatus Cloacimonadia bacterium]
MSEDLTKPVSLGESPDIPDNFVFVEGVCIALDERPQGLPSLISSFYISKYQLTQKEWVEVMGNNPSGRRGDNLPVEKISWYDTIDYCNKRSVKGGLTPCYSIDGDTNPSDWSSGKVECDWDANGYRLPTNAEWEFAAGGGNKSRGYVYSGSDNLDEVGWFDENSGDEIHPVGQKMPNELGLYDMSGNVAEWCWDWYDEKYLYKAPIKDPKGPESGDARVTRGGNCTHDEYECDIWYQGIGGPEERTPSYGARLVRSRR